MKRLVMVLAAGLVAACGAQAAPPEKAPGKAAIQSAAVKAPKASVLSPREAISAAAKDKDGVAGVFEFKVASIGGGERGRSAFLNSEADYRDPKNLTVMVRWAAAKEIEEALGAPLDKALAGKRVRVTGEAKQAKVNVYGEDHKRTGETETQTRITVASAEQVSLR